MDLKSVARRTGVRHSGLMLAVFGCVVAGNVQAQVRSRTRAKTAARSTLRLRADLSQRKLYVISGNATVRSYPIAIGDSAHPTPTGDFQIARIVWNPKWTPPEEGWAADKEPQPAGGRTNPMRLVKLFFQEPDYYIHGTNELRSVGYARSHGCLRMEPLEAYRLARMLMDHAGVRRSAAWYAHVLKTHSVTQTIRLPHPVAMEIVAGS